MRFGNYGLVNAAWQMWFGNYGLGTRLACVLTRLSAYFGSESNRPTIEQSLAHTLSVLRTVSSSRSIMKSSVPPPICRLLTSCSSRCHSSVCFRSSRTRGTFTCDSRYGEKSAHGDPHLHAPAQFSRKQLGLRLSRIGWEFEN